MAKSPDAFRTISEVAEWLEVPTHVLRFWESKFAQIKPVKRAGGRRYYRPSDMELIGGIKQLLHEDGMTIRGVQKMLREKGVRHVAAMSRPLDADDAEIVEPTDFPDRPEEAEVEVDDAETVDLTGADDATDPADEAPGLFDMPPPDAPDHAAAPEEYVAADAAAHRTSDGVPDDTLTPPGAPAVTAEVEAALAPLSADDMDAGAAAMPMEDDGDPDEADTTIAEADLADPAPPRRREIRMPDGVPDIDPADDAALAEGPGIAALISLAGDGHLAARRAVLTTVHAQLVDHLRRRADDRV